MSMKNDFIAKFVCGDNLPENISQRESIIMEARASLLIEAHFGSERFPAFLSKRDPGRILHISPKEGDPRPLKFHDGVISGETSAFELTPPGVSSKEQTALYMAGSDLTIWRVANNGGDRIYYSFEMRAAIIKGLEDSLRRGVLNFFNSAFEAIRRHSECDTPTKTCLYWGQEPRPYAAMKKIWGFHWNPWSTCHNLELRNIQPILNPEARVADVFTFNDKWGETLLRVLKIEYGGEKLLLPLTTWFRAGSNQPMFFFTPGESALPLFNLEQLEDCGDKTVILTDSVEIAAKNKGNSTTRFGRASTATGVIRTGLCSGKPGRSSCSSPTIPDEASPKPTERRRHLPSISPRLWDWRISAASSFRRTTMLSRRNRWRKVIWK